MDYLWPLGNYPHIWGWINWGWVTCGYGCGWPVPSPTALLLTHPRDACANPPLPFPIRANRYTAASPLLPRPLRGTRAHPCAASSGACGLAALAGGSHGKASGPRGQHELVSVGGEDEGDGARLTVRWRGWSALVRSLGGSGRKSWTVLTGPRSCAVATLTAT